MGKWSKKAKLAQSERMKAYWRGKMSNGTETGSTQAVVKLGTDSIIDKLNDIKAFVNEIATMIGG